MSHVLLDRVVAWPHTRLRKWVMMAAVFAVVAALFHPLFLVLGGVIGAVTFGVTILGGIVLGPLDGVLFALVTSILSVPLWSREYGFELTENISGPVISMLLAYGAAWVAGMVQNSREQSRSLKLANEALRETQLRLLHAEKLALFGEVAAGVAHEMNQPLAIIGLSAQMARKKLGSAKPDDLGQRLDTIQTQVQRASEIIRRLKNIGREDGINERRSSSLNEIVRNVTAQFEPQLQALGIDMQIRLGAALGPVHCNQVQMEQMLACLVLNARDAVSITVDKRIEIRTLDGDRMLALEVEDSGDGIARNVMPRIFDPFFTTKEIGNGSGLGLSICQRIVTDHGGTIEVNSAEGQGARFTVRLPRVLAPGEPGASAATPQAHNAEVLAER